MMLPVLVVVGKEVRSALEAQEDGDGGRSSGTGGDAEVVVESETMVAWFVRDVSIHRM
jgi:hypothetical protein